MQIELRKSGGPACEKCGATEVILSPLTNEAVVEEIAPVLEREAARFEEELRALFTDEARSREKKFAAFLARTQARYEEDVRLAFGDVGRFRFFKKRWQQSLRAEVEAALERVRDEAKR
jgi:hypothetical protein